MHYKESLNLSRVNLKYIWLMLVAIAVFSSCKLFSTTDKTSMEENEYIKVLSAYVQKEIPGQQDGTIKTFMNLHLSFNTSDNIDLTSILYKNRSYTINKNRLKLKIAIAQENTKTKAKNSPNNKLIIFYLQNNKKRELVLQDIEQKEDLYLP